MSRITCNTRITHRCTLGEPGVDPRVHLQAAGCLAAESSGILHPTARQLFTQLVGETQAERRRRMGAGVWMQGDKGTTTYWSGVMKVSLLGWVVGPVLVLE